MSLFVKSCHEGKKHPILSLDEKQADKVFALYRKFLDEAPCRDFPRMVEDFRTVKSCPYSWGDLDIGISCERMEKVLGETGVFPLREPDKDCRVLVVGCGNGPVANEGGYPLAPKHLNEDEAEEYRELHEHRDAITINPHLAANPTIVGYFGLQRFPMLADGQFDRIVIEGISIDFTLEGQEELNRLLSSKGKVVDAYDIPES